MNDMNECIQCLIAFSVESPATSVGVESNAHSIMCFAHLINFFHENSALIFQFVQFFLVFTITISFLLFYQRKKNILYYSIGIIEVFFFVDLSLFEYKKKEINRIRYTNDLIDAKHSSHVL